MKTEKREVEVCSELISIDQMVSGILYIVEKSTYELYLGDVIVKSYDNKIICIHSENDNIGYIIPSSSTRVKKLNPSIKIVLRNE